MSEYDPLFAAAEQKYGLPPNILKATAAVESSFDPNATSPTGVRGLMQIDGKNARHFGGNRLDPAQAIDMAGQLWAQNMKATNGDIDASAVRYNGGGDPNYVNKMHSFLTGQQGQPKPQGNDLSSIVGATTAPQAAPTHASSGNSLESIVGNAMPATDATPLPNVAAGTAGNQV